MSGTWNPRIPTTRPSHSEDSRASLERALDVLDLDPPCARVYAHLCWHGRSKAGPIAGATGLSRADVYRALAKLTQLGFVDVSPTRPAGFEAVDPEKVFARAFAESRNRKSVLMDAPPLLLEFWEGDEPPGPDGDVAYRLVTGRTELHVTAGRMVAGAAHSVLVLDTLPHCHMSAATGIASGAAPPDTVDLRIVAANRASDSPDAWFLIVDGKEGLFIETTPGAGILDDGLYATWTNSPTLIAMANALHTSWWLRTRADEAATSVDAQRPL